MVYAKRQFSPDAAQNNINMSGITTKTVFLWFSVTKKVATRVSDSNGIKRLNLG